MPPLLPALRFRHCRSHLATGAKPAARPGRGNVGSVDLRTIFCAVFRPRETGAARTSGARLGIRRARCHRCVAASRALAATCTRTTDSATTSKSQTRTPQRPTSLRAWHERRDHALRPRCARAGGASRRWCCRCMSFENRPIAERSNKKGGAAMLVTSSSSDGAHAEQVRAYVCVYMLRDYNKRYTFVRKADPLVRSASLSVGLRTR